MAPSRKIASFSLRGLLLTESPGRVWYRSHSLSKDQKEAHSICHWSLDLMQKRYHCSIDYMLLKYLLTAGGRSRRCWRQWAADRKQSRVKRGDGEKTKCHWLPVH